MVSEIKSDVAGISVYTDFFNKRIRIDDYSGDKSGVLELVFKSIPDWAEKIIMKVREPELSFFESKGFLKEAFIKGYFNGIDMHFLVKYVSAARGQNQKQADEQKILERILKEKIPSGDINLEVVSLATEADVDALAGVYSIVFNVYRTPMADPEYIRKTIREGTKYVKNKLTFPFL